MSITETKSISFEELNQFLYKVISKNEPSLDEDKIEEIINAYLEESNISFQNNTLPTSIIVDKAKNSNSSKTYINDTLISLFSFQNENIIKILTQCLTKLQEYKETSLVDQLNWVILLLGKDYFKVEIDANDIHAIQFMKEYSCDSVNLSKEKDLQIAKNLSLEREKKVKRNSVGLKSKFQTNVNKEIERSFKRTYSLHPKAVFKCFDSDKALKKNSIDIEIPTPNEEKQEDNQEVNLNEMSNEKYKIKDEIDEEEEPVNTPKNNINNGQTNYFKNEQINSSSSLPFVIVDNKANTIFDDIDFNIFNYVEEAGRISVLYNISNAILNKYNFFTFVNSERFHTFIDKIRVGYDYLIPYHNDLHAADVLQTCHFIINSNSIKVELDLTSLDICGLFIAAIVHDFKHPGLNNTYHMNKRTSIAIRYNDFSILEQLHISSAFKILSHPNSNIFCDLSIEEFRIIRKRMVECVLGTDMARHAKALNNLRKKVDHLNLIKESTGSSVCELLVNYIPDENKFDRQQELLTFIIHCADISNTGKIFPICKTWTLLVMNEFFLQGDKEKQEELPISFLCDRNNTNIPKSQISFISNIAIPCFNTLELLFPHCQLFTKNQKDNIANWELEEKEKN